MCAVMLHIAHRFGSHVHSESPSSVHSRTIPHSGHIYIWRVPLGATTLGGATCEPGACALGNDCTCGPCVSPTKCMDAHFRTAGVSKCTIRRFSIHWAIGTKIMS